MDTDPSFPRTVFFDGAEIRVDTAEELAALPSGWRDSADARAARLALRPLPAVARTKGCPGSG